MLKKYLWSAFFAGLALNSYAQKPGVFKGQGPIQGASTTDKPVERQWRGVYKTDSDNVFFGNNFTGASLHGVRFVPDTGYVVSIKPENQPVNGSPWYAFKVWAQKPEKIKIKFTYPGKYRHRYDAKISRDGIHWKAVDEQSVGLDAKPKDLIDLEVGPDTLWVSAQELLTSKDADRWAKALSKFSKIKEEKIGTTHLGRPLKVFTLGNLSSNKHILIFGRQHPPEVTGQLAMQSFADALVSSGKLSKAFLADYQLHIIPVLNPDGVDEGFWRHNAGGIDLNRDWANFNQPETRAVRDYLKKKIADVNGKLVFAIDFHSTHDDIYYIVDPKLKSKYPGLIDNWLKNTVKNIPDYLPNIKTLYEAPPTYTSFSYLYENYGAEALVYEIGDKTSRDFINEKAKISAIELIKLLESNDIKGK
ncbi:M14 family metallopeptidase [Pedobacter agri]|uniref:M14 family metallopeptidase n=1 Tax=Pedobacter agri TaxID=454586 RepID=UPI002931BCD5|nr:M14 family metallopeptidase [Pedobacter agri]